MDSSQTVDTLTLLFTAVGLFGAMLGLLEVGRWIGKRHHTEDPDAAKGLGPMEGAVYGLMGLLIAFTFSGAGSRFDARRELIVREANAIGTAFLRIDLLPEADRPGLREVYRRYLESRISFYHDLSGRRAMARETSTRSLALQGQIWNQSVDALGRMGRDPKVNAVTSLVTESMNSMFDITTAHAMALQTHPPPEVYGMMAILLLASSLLAGYETSLGKQRSWVHLIGFAGILAASIFVILDFEYPRVGLIRVDPADQFLVDLLSTMR
jgi:hypothetical protein